MISQKTTLPYLTGIISKTNYFEKHFNVWSSDKRYNISYLCDVTSYFHNLVFVPHLVPHKEVEHNCSFPIGQKLIMQSRGHGLQRPTAHYRPSSENKTVYIIRASAFENDNNHVFTTADVPFIVYTKLCIAIKRSCTWSCTRIWIRRPKISSMFWMNLLLLSKRRNKF